MLKIVGVLMFCFSASVLAQSYPAKPVRVIIPYPPGAVGDIMMRTVGERLGTLLGQPFVIENRAGGGGLAATEAVAKAPADGYTLLFNGPNHVTNLGLYKNVPYDPIADFAPISYVSSSQTILVTHASSGLKTVKELVAAAKAKPNALNYASSGNGTGTHLSMEMFMRATGIQLTHIPFKGATPAFTALASGQVQVGFTTPPLAKQFIQEGRLHALAVGGSKRLTGFPEVPSLGDLGLLNYDVEVWFGLLGPKGTPQPVVDLLAKEIKRVLSEPGMFEKFDALGFTIVGSTPAQFAEHIKRETARWPKVIKELGITAG